MPPKAKARDLLVFSPRIQPKRVCKSNNAAIIQPAPILLLEDEAEVASTQQFCGIFTGISVEITDAEAICKIYENGFYGKGNKSRGAPMIVRGGGAGASGVGQDAKDESLVLMLEEAFFLAYMVKCLKIEDLNSMSIELLEFIQKAESVNPSFMNSLAAYVYLKSKSWIVKSGLKFGGDFLAYKKGPKFYHASFVVFVRDPSDTEYLESKNIKAMQRVAETSGKHLLVLEVKTPKNFSVTSVEDLADIYVSELIVRRFNLTEYVQKKDLS